MVCGSADLCDRGGATLAIAPPLAAPTGAPNDAYSMDEDVYAAGSGFTTDTNVDIHVVPGTMAIRSLQISQLLSRQYPCE